VHQLVTKTTQSRPYAIKIFVEKNQVTATFTCLRLLKLFGKFFAGDRHGCAKFLRAIEMCTHCSRRCFWFLEDLQFKAKPLSWEPRYSILPAYSANSPHSKSLLPTHSWQRANTETARVSFNQQLRTLITTQETLYASPGILTVA